MSIKRFLLAWESKTGVLLLALCGRGGKQDQKKTVEIHRKRHGKLFGLPGLQEKPENIVQFRISYRMIIPQLCTCTYSNIYRLLYLAIRGRFRELTTRMPYPRTQGCPYFPFSYDVLRCRELAEGRRRQKSTLVKISI